MLSDDLYEAILSHLTDGVYMVDRERQIVFWNDAAEKITGFKREEIQGKHCQDNLLNHVDEAGRLLCVEGCPLHATIQDGDFREADVFLRHKDGYRVPVHVKAIPLHKGGEIVGAVEIFTDNSPMLLYKKKMSPLSRLVTTDQLTGMYNRRYIETFIEEKLFECKRFGVQMGIVLAQITTLPQEQALNPEMEEIILRAVSSTLLHNKRDNDVLARWSEDEFLGVYFLKDEEELLEIGEKIRVVISSTEVRSETGDVIPIAASVGLALLQSGDTLQSVVQRVIDQKLIVGGLEDADQPPQNYNMVRDDSWKRK